MKLYTTALLGAMLIASACKKDSDKNGGLSMTNPPANFRGLKATVNGQAIVATASSIHVRRSAGDPGIGALPSLLITGEFEKKRLEVEIHWDAGTQPKTGTYELTYDVDRGHYYAKVYFDENVDAPSSANTYYGSPSVDNELQLGRMNVTVVDDHHFVGAFSAIVKHPLTEITREVINGQFGGEY